MPVERQWTVPEDQGPEIGFDAEGNLLVQPRVVREDDEDALWETFLECRAILRRVGGTIQMASQRVEIAPGVVVTESYIVAYNSFTPLVRKLHGEDLEDGPEADADALSDDEMQQHFPDGPLADIAVQATQEVPATDDAEADAALEQAGTVVE